MIRVRTVMYGFDGSPYYSNQYFGGNTEGAAAAAAAATAGFWDDIKGYITSGVGIQVGEITDLVDTATGQVTDSWNKSQTEVVTTGNAPLPPATQGLVRLKTNFWISGRRLQGRIFIPSLANDAQTGGEPSTGFKTAMAAAMNTFLPAASPAGLLGVYSRTHHEFATVQSFSVWDQFAVLRSRRD